jgi:hypothetical protein
MEQNLNMKGGRSDVAGQHASWRPNPLPYSFLPDCFELTCSRVADSIGNMYFLVLIFDVS